MKRKIYILLLLFVVSITPFIFNYSNLKECSSIKDFMESLESEVPHLLTEYNIPGASISIIENAQVSWVGTFDIKM